MTLIVPYYIYGEVKVDGVVQESATVAVSTENTTTNADGLYQLNIQDVATDGASVTVTATYSGDSDEDSFTLDISDPFKEIDFDITASEEAAVDTEGFSIYGDGTTTVYGGDRTLTIYG